MSDLSKMKSDMEEAWESVSMTGAITIALGQLRLWSATETARDDIAAFLKNTSNLPDEAAVKLTKISISLLVDDDNNVLAFR